jgi:hypothetical protein
MVGFVFASGRKGLEVMPQESLRRRPRVGKGRTFFLAMQRYKNAQPQQTDILLPGGGWFAKEGKAMSFVVTPNARETFTRRELTESYTNFEERGPQYVSDESGLRGSAYRFGTRVLLVYEESETGVVVLISATS